LSSLKAYHSTFSLRSVGVIADETWTLSSPLPPVRAVIRFLHTEGKSAAEIHEFMAPGTRMPTEVYCEMLNKLRRSIQNKWRGMLTNGVVLLHHTAARTNALIKLFKWEIFDHPPYSPDLAPSDYHLFTKLVWLAA
jgi:hypothetical protein